MFYFYKVAFVQYLGEVDIFSYTRKKLSSSLQQCKNYKNQSIEIFHSYDHKCTATFLWFTVYVFMYFTFFMKWKTGNYLLRFI